MGLHTCLKQGDLNFYLTVRIMNTSIFRFVNLASYLNLTDLETCAEQVGSSPW